MICAIRIRGGVGLDRDVTEALNRLRLRRKYSCIVLKPNPVIEGMIRKVKDFVAYGEINDGVFEKLIEKRGQIIDTRKKSFRK